MSIGPQPEKRGFTRLRDFGAFQTVTSLSALHSLSAGGTALAEYDTVRLSAEQIRHPAIDRVKSWWERSAIASVLQHKVIRLSLQIGVTSGLLLILSLSISWPTLFAALSHIHKGMLLVAAVVGTGGVVLSAYQWRGLLRAAHLYVDLADLIKLYLVGIAFSHVLPTSLGGDAVKALYVGRGEEGRICSAGALLLCRITGFLAMLLVALPALLIWHARLNSVLCLWLCLLMMFVGGAIACVLLLLTLLHRFAGSFMQRSLWLKCLNPMNKSLYKQLWSPPALLRATVSGWIFWCVAVLNCYCYASALGLIVPFYFFLIAVPFIALMSFLPVSLNGYGLREGAFVFAFTTMHVSSAQALLLALLLDCQALCFAALGIYLYVTLRNTWRASAG